jgi:2-methylcitrate dehydratase PrpD
VTTFTWRLADWASGLRLDQVPARTVELAKIQVLSQLAAIRAGRSHPLGQALVRAFGPPLQDDPCRSAGTLAGLGSWLNLDDTAYAGHLSNSTVAVPLAFCRARGLGGADLLAAVVAANECAARVTAAATLGPFRGQTAAHTSLVGAVAGRLHADRAPARRWADALGLALAMPPWTLIPAYVGSDARVLGALLPVSMAMQACEAAMAGLRGMPDVIEHPGGFLAKFTAVPLPEAVCAGLGQRWHTDTLSFKVRPCGPGIDAAVDCAVALHRELGGRTVGEISDVLVEASVYTVRVGQAIQPHEAGPDTPAGALPLSVPYTVATALLSGDLTVADFTAPAVEDPARWKLAQSVRLRHDERMTAELLRSVAPFGEAIRQAGPRAAGWVSQFTDGMDISGPLGAAQPAGGFAHATKRTPARVTVRLADGRTASMQRSIPIGGAGAGSPGARAELVRAKFRAAGGDDRVAAVCARLEHVTAAELATALERAFAR